MRYLLWDFDGTLAVRHEGWSGALVDLLQRSRFTDSVTREQIVPHLQTGFPWHVPDEPHPHLASPDLWWQALHPVFRRAYEAVGVPPAHAAALVTEVRHSYLSPAKWSVFEDTVPVLSKLRDAGWKHVLLSNHVPELGELVDALGLERFFEHVFCSAVTGYEKPHAEAFRCAVASIPEGAQVWMVGDNFRADVLGAEAVGLPAILVRSNNAAARYQCASLNGLHSIIDG